jgi:Ulp1 protease family, C-terminal catalytic domain
MNQDALWRQSLPDDVLRDVEALERKAADDGQDLIDEYFRLKDACKKYNVKLLNILRQPALTVIGRALVRLGPSKGCIKKLETSRWSVQLSALISTFGPQILFSQDFIRYLAQLSENTNDADVTWADAVTAINDAARSRRSSKKAGIDTTRPYAPADVIAAQRALRGLDTPSEKPLTEENDSDEDLTAATTSMPFINTKSRKRTRSQPAEHQKGVSRKRQRVLSASTPSPIVEVARGESGRATIEPSCLSPLTPPSGPFNGDSSPMLLASPAKTATRPETQADTEADADEPAAQPEPDIYEPAVYDPDSDAESDVPHKSQVPAAAEIILSSDDHEEALPIARRMPQPDGLTEKDLILSQLQPNAYLGHLTIFKILRSLIPAHLVRILDVGNFPTDTEPQPLTNRPYSVEQDLVLAPLNINVNKGVGHWVLLVYDLKTRTFSVLDSLTSYSDVNDFKKLGEFSARIAKRLQRPGQVAQVDNEPWTFKRYERVEQQQDGVSCGVHLLVNALSVVSRGRPHDKPIISNVWRLIFSRLFSEAADSDLAELFTPTGVEAVEVDALPQTGRSQGDNSTDVEAEALRCIQRLLYKHRHSESASAHVSALSQGLQEATILLAALEIVVEAAVPTQQLQHRENRLTDLLRRVDTADEYGDFDEEFGGHHLRISLAKLIARNAKLLQQSHCCAAVGSLRKSAAAAMVKAEGQLKDAQVLLQRGLAARKQLQAMLSYDM